MGIGLTMGTLFCIIQVGPMLSHMSCEVKEGQNKDETVPKKRRKKKSQRNIKLMALKKNEGDQRILEISRCFLETMRKQIP